MNDQKIYELIAAKPAIRAVQIADALDQELSDVSEALRALVAEGDVVRSSATGPNGHPTQIYTLSDQFMKSKEYKSIMVKMATASPQPATPAAAAAVPVDKTARNDGQVVIAHRQPINQGAAPTLTPAVAPTPSTLAVTAPPPAAKTRVASAIEFVRASGGRVSNVLLARHMGLGTGHAPVGYLSAALNDGRLGRDGLDWIIGSGSAPAPAKRAAGPVFRCGIWSDGVLELQRDGATVTTLTRDEGEQMAAFIGRMLVTVEPAEK